MDSAPNAENPTPQAPPTPKEEPPYNHRRNGFVAHKPKEVRDKINFMLLDGFTYRKVIENLGDNGKDLDEDHIRTWHAGGFQEFLVILARKEALQTTRDAALELVSEKADTPVQDAGLTVAAAQLYELLLSFEPTAFANALSEKPELYLRLINALSRLCESGAAVGYRRTHKSVLAAKLQAASEEPTEKKLLTQEELKELMKQLKII